MRLLFIVFLCFGISLQQDEIDINIPPPVHVTTNHLKVNAPYTLKIGVVGMTGLLVAATNVAAEYINNNLSIIPDVAMQIYSYNTTGDADILFSTLYLSLNLRANGIIGATTSSQTKTAQTIAKLYSIPEISGSAIASSLTSADYPYFLRTITDDSGQITAVLKVLLEFGWGRGVLIYTNDEYGTAGSSTLLLRASASNISLAPLTVSASGTSMQDYATEADLLRVQASKNGYRIFVMWTSRVATTNIMQAFNASGLVGPPYAWILTGDVVNMYKSPDSPFANTSILDGAIGFGYGIPGGVEYDIALNYWKTRTNVTQYVGYNVTPFFVYDAVLAYAYAFNHLLNAGVPFANISGRTLFRQLVSQSFQGTTGNITLAPNGNRIGTWEMWNWHGSTPAHVGTFSVGNQNLSIYGNVLFNNGSHEAPAAIPFQCPACKHGTCVEGVGCVCIRGYKGQSCDVKDQGSNVVVWLVPLLASVVLLFIGGYFWYKRKRTLLVKKVAEKQRSVISRSDLTLSTRIGRGASGEVWKGVYRGTDVAVKKIVAPSVDKRVITSFELEVAIMCGLRHPNIVLFMGSCFDVATREMLLVMEYMARGSLNDVLNNHNIPITHEMKLHLAIQAAQGMNFLHQSTPPILHLDLKSANILLDDKWNARISDFGIAKLKEETHSGGGARGQCIGTIYWAAPEALEGNATSEKCDCYSFGIVLWEIWHREMPYHGRDPVSVAVEVIFSGLRPTISSAVPNDIQELIKACWAQNPADRPSFQEIVSTLRSISLVPQSQQLELVRPDAPTGQVYLVATNVLGAYALWEAAPREMEEAMTTHNQIMRANTDLYRGYEVSFINHSFTAAFASVEDAIDFTIVVQVSLLNAEWPTALLEQPICRPVFAERSNVLLWNGLRVRMAVCSGVPNCYIDSGNGRMTYFGPVAERLQSILALPFEVTVLLDDAVADQLDKNHPHLLQECSTSKAGQVKISRHQMEDVHQLHITSLAGRALPRFPNDVGSGREILAEDVTAQLQKTVTWIAYNSEIKVRGLIGKGLVADYLRGLWKGKEVAVKVLANQKLKEADLFKLLGDSAYISKLNHPNILPFYAICMEPSHLSILSEYIPKGNLQLILADLAIQLPLVIKIKIALGMARGMAFLTSLPDAHMQIHDNLKSNNVLVGRDWEVKIADYGYSNIVELARTMTAIMNIAWTAPELLVGQDCTPKIATYSFGIILWEIYTRQVPYENEHPIRMVPRILEGYRPPLPTDCLPAYKQLVDRCLDGNPELRPSWEVIINSLAEISKAVNSYYIFRIV